MMKTTNKFYLAYGSNLNLEQMAYRCPTAKVVGASEIKDYKLLFRGAHEGAVATIEPHKGNTVPVLVWNIKPGDEAALDRYEGFPFLYRKEWLNINLNGENISAMAYIMNAENPVGCHRMLGQPSAYYYSTILAGYKDAGFDIEVLRQATIDSAITEEKADE